MSKPSVVFINRVYPPVRGATGRMLRDLARSFAREGWQVTIVTSGPRAEKGRDGPIQIMRVKGPEKPSHIFGYIWIWLKMFVVALRLPPRNLVVTMTDPPLLVLAGSIISKVKKSRHIHWCQDLYPDILPALGFRLPGFAMQFFRTLSGRALKKCDKVIVIGRCMAEQINLTGLDSKRVVVIPNWPDFELMRPAGMNSFNPPAVEIEQPNGAKPYESLLKNGPKFRVLYAGNIGRAHPLESIIGAAEILQTENPEIEFVFVGDGTRFDEVAAERSRLGLDNIRLLPYQPANRLRELMESGDLHIISMADEAAGCLVPSKLYAALAAQRPVILVGPENSETAKVIQEFQAGTIVPQGQARALVDAIRTYRFDSDAWFNAQSGAASAGKIFVPRESIEAWMEGAWGVVEPDFGRHTVKRRA